MSLVDTLSDNEAVGFPTWVYHQMWNWSAWCWEGPWPHPLPATHGVSIESRYVPPGCYEEDEPGSRRPKLTIHLGNAGIVQNIYDTLPIVEQRVIQYEYPRRHEFDEYNFRGELIRNIRVKKGCQILRVNQVYYRMAAYNVLTLVHAAFLKDKVCA